MVHTKYYDLQAVFRAAGQPGTSGKMASQLMHLHRLVMQRESPQVLECGVNQGWSSGVLAHACEQRGGHPVSLDIEDCSAAIQSDLWAFLQRDDLARDAVLRDAPWLAQGIDLLYIR